LVIAVVVTPERLSLELRGFLRGTGAGRHHAGTDAGTGGRAKHGQGASDLDI